MTDEMIARVCHQANKAYCESLGDKSQKDWEETSEEQRASVRNGVNFIRTNPGLPASASHENWLKYKRAEGWVYGPIKSEITKEHPCCVAFTDLSPEDQAKDKIFKGIVMTLAKV